MVKIGDFVMCILRAALIAVMLAGASFATAGPARAQDWLESLTQSFATGKKYWESKVKKFPGNGSYFQLVRDQRSIKGHSVMFWRFAEERARERRHDGRQGRLAIIDSPELYSWLIEQWDFSRIPYWGEGTWIGLRYWCDYRKLMWADGSILEFDDFAAWDTPWYRDDGIRCGVQDLDYMGVYIYKDSNRWRATGEQKGWSFYLVEYPPPPQGNGDRQAQE